MLLTGLDDLTVGAAAALLMEAIEDGAGEYDMGLADDAAPLVAALSDEAARGLVTDLPEAEREAWRGLLRRAGLFMPPTRRVILGSE